jgi:hypothetical protein
LVSSSNYAISSNSITSCSAVSSVIGGNFSFGANVYGGGVSLGFGAYSYGAVSIISSVSESTVVSSVSFTISDNTWTACNASIKILPSFTHYGSKGLNVYGGSLSLSVGAYSYALKHNSDISGSTVVTDTHFNCSNNTLIGSSATSLVTADGSSGGNMYGGGFSLAVGAYSYAPYSSNINVAAETSIIESGFTISSNILTGCRAVSSISSNGTNVYGGGISIAFGAYSYSSVGKKKGVNDIVSGTSVSNTVYTISGNLLTNCSAESSAVLSFQEQNQKNVYGGGLSLMEGAYSYSSNDCTVSGNTSIANTNYSISNNTVTGCSAVSSVTGGGDSKGANLYGGGVSVTTGAYSSSSSSSSSSSVSGSSLVSSSNYDISSNSITSCSAVSSVTGGGASKGVNVYGGGVSLAIGAYSYSSSSSSVSGSNLVSSASYSISGNTLTGCSAVSSGTGGGNSIGANVYGGGVSLAIGAYSYSSGGSSSSSVSGSTSVSSASYSISGNTLTGCSAVSSVTGSGSDLNGANVYGSCVSLAVGAYSYGYFGSSIVSGSTIMSNAVCIILSNSITGCSAVFVGHRRR